MSDDDIGFESVAGTVFDPDFVSELDCRRITVC